MRAAVALTLLLAACAGKPHAAPTSGPPTTEAPQVLGMSEERLDFSQTPPTTTTTTTTVMTPVVSTTAPQNMNVITTTVPMTAPPPAVERTGDCGGWDGVIASHFPAGEVSTACAVMMCESQGNPNAISPTNDHGLFQINVVHRNSFDWSRRYDPHVNTAYAASLWGRKGWQPWTCQP